MRGRLQRPEVEPRVARGLDGRHHHRHVVGLAAGHDGGDGDLFHRRDAHRGTHLAEDHVGIQAARENEPLDTLGRRDHDG